MLPTNYKSVTVASRIVVTTIAALSILALAGCGADGEAGASASNRTPSETVASSPSPTVLKAADTASELKQAVQAYSDAFLVGDVKAYDMFSKRCQNRTDKNEFIGMLMAAKSAYGSALPLKTFDAEISGDLARVSYTYSLSAINQESEPWAREGGQWKQDDC